MFVDTAITGRIPRSSDFLNNIPKLAQFVVGIVT